MSTPSAPQNAGPNIGASRLLGTNNLQQAVDSLTVQVNKITASLAAAASSINNLTGTTNRTTGGSRTGNTWNSTSNRSNYSSNGGGGSFSGFGNRLGMSPNGGARFATTVGAGFGLAAGLTAYGNRNMSTNMQMNMAGVNSAIAGGFTGSAAGPTAFAQRQLFANNYVALDANDAARAGYINQFTFGNSQFNGQANRAFSTGMAQVQGFGYSSPTLGASAAATAAQQTYTARAAIMSQALGLRPTIGAGGVKASMGDIAQSIYQQTFGNKAVSARGFNAAISQGGSLSVNLQYIGQQLGWNATTTMEYQNYLQGMNAALNKGMSRTQYDTLSQQAAVGNKTAINTLAKTTGLGTSIFETQRNLNSTRLTRQEDILESLAPAFNDATNMVNKFSAALTQFLQNTGLDKAIGTGAGWGSAISGGLSGFGGAFGAAGGLMTAMRLFGGGGGGLGGLFGRMGGMGGGGAGGVGGLINATRGANGVYNITSLAGGASGMGGMLARGGAYGAAAAAVAGAGLLGWKGSVGAEASHENVFLQGLSKALKYNVGDPLSAVYTGAGDIRRVYDKFITGKNKESVWSLLNPWGSEKRMTNTDGRSGGGSNANSGSGGSGANGVTNGTGASGSQVVQFAETQLGVPYVWGGTTPGKGLDCSGLTQWAYGKAGVSIPRTSEEQQTIGSDVNLNSVQAGDLLFKGTPAHHVAMAIGGGKLIEAPHTGLNVRIRSFSAGEFTNAKRIVGNVGNAGSLLNGNTGNAVKNTLSNSQSRVGGNTGDMSGISERSIILSALSSSIGSLPSGGSTSASSTAGTSQLGTTPTGNGGNDKTSLQAYARQLLNKYGWGGQWNSFDALVMSESGWDYKATNPSSGAYGIPQALPGSKMASAGSDWRTSGDTQLRWMMDYVQGRYGDPNKAWAFHQKHNWYASGAWSIDQDQAAQVHKGEMILPAKQAETVRSAITNAITNKSSSGPSSGSIGAIHVHVNLPTGYSGTQQEAYTTGKMIVDAITNDARVKQLQRGQ